MTEPASGDGFLEEVDRFRAWNRSLGKAPRSPEWECDYQHWRPLERAFEDFLDTHSPQVWTADELAALLYAVARDNECQTLAGALRERPEALFALADASFDCGEHHARWQLADQLGRLEDLAARAEPLVLRFANDEHEYVRRRALQSLARLKSAATERVALECWSRPDESRPWARMMALWSLHRIRSPTLERLLVEAEQDPNPYLSDFAKRVRLGRVDP